MKKALFFALMFFGAIDQTLADGFPKNGDTVIIKAGKSAIIYTAGKSVCNEPADFKTFVNLNPKPKVGKYFDGGVVKDTYRKCGGNLVKRRAIGLRTRPTDAGVEFTLKMVSKDRITVRIVK